MGQLPDDISRTIFELAAEGGSGPPCALVSKEVQSWVEPVLYRRVVLWKQKTIALFCRTLQEASQEASRSKTIGLLASYIQILIVVSPITRPIGAIVGMLKSLRNLQTLMLWDWHTTLHEVVTSSHLAPTRLSLTRPRLLQAQRHFTHSMFRNVTHLELVWRDPDCWDGWNWDSLLQLTHLTHLALNLISNFLLKASPSRLLELVKDMISKCPSSVRVFLLWIPTDIFLHGAYSNQIAFERACDVDRRVVVGCFDPSMTDDPGSVPDCAMVKRALRGLIEDWAAVSFRIDFWALAEEVIEERRRELPPSGGSYN